MSAPAGAGRPATGPAGTRPAPDTVDAPSAGTGRRPARLIGEAGRARRPRRPTPAERRGMTKAEYDGPHLPDNITGKELSREVAGQLPQPAGSACRSGGQASGGGRAAGRLRSGDRLRPRPRRAGARRPGGRGPGGLRRLAYLDGRWAEALRELKTVRRMTGRPDHLPVLADCERALGRPDRALALCRDPAAERLDAEGRAELAIVAAGARRGRGEIDAALALLEASDLRTKSRSDWAPRLRYAYADALEAAGRAHRRPRVVPPGGGRRRPGQHGRGRARRTAAVPPGRLTPLLSPRRVNAQPAAREQPVHRARAPLDPAGAAGRPTLSVEVVQPCPAVPCRTNRQPRLATPCVHLNQVRLRGRVSAPAEQRILPSGDLLVTARVVVRRTGSCRAGIGSRSTPWTAWPGRAASAGRCWPGNRAPSSRSRGRSGAASPGAPAV